ncbi:MAG: multicopper oxidase domain-containing protein [Streptosporangiales bacterium]|nr:multicopper oxidase domain-containing protein [Streptosporangiales bacterium]
MVVHARRGGALLRRGAADRHGLQPPVRPAHPARRVHRGHRHRPVLECRRLARAARPAVPASTLVSVSRRGFLGLAGGLGAALALPGCAALVREVQTGELLRSTAKLPRPFSVPLPIPPVATRSRRTSDIDFYDITARETEAEILPGVRTRILGYDGIFPGPTIVSRRGRRTVVRHANELTVPMVVHLHGGHTPPESDGFPVDLVFPRGYESPESGHDGRIARGSRQYSYPMRQRAATLWYHDHRMDFTGPQVYRGLAGFHLVHDDEEDALPLPKGDHDVPLMICDRAFDEDGTFLYPSLDPALRTRRGVANAYMEGVLGDVVLVNGAPWPEMEVTATRYRFRILNASNARRYRLALTPKPGSGSPFVQVGSDGGLLAAPHELGTVPIAPAERFDVVIDFSAYPVGSTVTLTNELGDAEGTTQVMRFRVTRKEKDDSRVPAKLSEFEVLRPEQAKVERRFRFGRDDLSQHQMWTINGRLFDPARMDARPRLGQVERWRFVTDLHHPVHLHLDSFQVQRDADNDNGWKDTVDVRPGEVVDVLVRFTDYAGAYVFHCHNLEHEDMAMMAAFETVA